MEEDSDDPVVKEIDVYLSKQLEKKLYLLQYPVRPGQMTYDDTEFLAARIKPKQQKLEVEVSVNTRSSNYDASKGEQVAINVDGPTPGESPVYLSGKMDKQVLSSTHSGLSTARYVIGTLKESELHLTPLHSMVHMRPSFSYLDKVDNRQKPEAEGGEESQDEEPEAKAVTVKFARRETAESKARRLASYDYLRKKQNEEAWIKLRHHPIKDPHVENERQYLYASQVNEVSEFHTASETYLEKLIPKMELQENEKPALPSNVLSMTDLKRMNLTDQVRALLINAKVIRTSQLLSLLPKGTDSTAMLRCLQQVALLVQGCWVVKSEVLYPKNVSSAHSGAPSDALCRGRDYILWRFTQSRYIVRKDISPVIKLVAEDVKEMLEQVSRLKVKKGWEFLLEADQDFISRHPDIVQRQNMIWEAKFKQLSLVLKLPPGDIKMAAVQAASSVTPPKRKRTVSRSRTKSGGAGSMSESMSDTENDAGKGERSRRASGSSKGRKNSGEHRRQSSGSGSRRRHSSGVGSQDENTAEYHLTNGVVTTTTTVDMETDDMSPENLALEMKKVLIPFVKEKLCRHFVIRMVELKTLFNGFLTQLPPGHVLGKGVTEKLLEQSVYEAGGIKMLHAQIKSSESIFALGKIGDTHDPLREVLLDFMQKQIKFQTKAIRKAVEDSLGEPVEDTVLKKVIKEYCEYKSGYFVLKGVLQSSGS